MKLRLWAALALAALSLTAANATVYYIPTFYSYAPPTPSADPGSYTAFHKVAVISALGSKFTVTGRDDKLAPFDISSLNVDQRVNALLKKYLGSRFDFVDMPAGAAAAEALSHNYFGETKTVAYLKTLPNPGVDAYIVIRPVGGSLPGPDGLGLQVSNGWAELWANFELDIIDARSFRVVATAASRIQTREEQEPLYAALEIDGFRDAQTQTAPSPAEYELLSHAIDELVPRAMVETLRVLKMGVALPPVGDHSIAEPTLAYTLTGIKKIAVISALSDEVRLVKGGHLFIKRFDLKVPTPDWGLDEQVEAMAKQALAANYTVMPADTYRMGLAGTVLRPAGYIPNLPGLLPSNAIDAYVVFMKVGDGWNFASLQSGLGLFHWIPAGDEYTAVYARYAVIVVDAHSLQPLAGVIAQQPAKNLCKELHPFVSRVPHCKIDDKFAPEPADQLNDQTKRVMIDTLKSVLAATVPDTLFHAGLKTTP